MDAIRVTTGKSIGLGLETPIGGMANKLRALHVGQLNKDRKVKKSLGKGHFLGKIPALV